jgi:hypothetical protein
VKVLVVLLLIVAIPVVLMYVTRRGVPGERGSDPQGNRDTRKHGGPPPGTWPNNSGGPTF